MADHNSDDDATRIYRPYGSPPPDPSEESAPSSPDPFAPEPNAEPPAADPFAPEPTAADPFAPSADPFAPEPSTDPFAPAPQPSEHDDPFRQPAADTPDPFAPSDDPFASPGDPFAPSGNDPFSPAPEPPAADPFAPPADDPFAPSAKTEPPASDPFAPPPTDAADPFRSPAASDPFAPAPSSPDPFSPSPPAPPSPTPPAASPDPFAGSGPDPFDVTPDDPFAPAPPVPDRPAVPDREDPFASTPSTSTDDPFASLQGPSGGGPAGGFDSGFHPTGDRRPQVEIPKAFGAEDTLAGAFTPVFSLILQIRSAQDLGDPTALRQRVEALLSEAGRTARENGAPDEDVQDATFCLVAFLDEAILASDWPGHGAWSAEPLQLTHYDRYDAGERFFDRLKRLLDEGGTRKAVLEVYYLCLALGFKGRYAIHGREVLRRLVDDLYTRISAGNGPGKLAPRGTSREVPAEAEKGGIPSWALWVGAAVLVALLYLGLSFSLSSAANDTADDLRTLSTRAAD